MDILALLKSYVAAQEGLCAALDYDASADKSLFNLPKRGTVSFEGETWSYHKHGVGVCFKNPINDAEIDVHEHLESPSAFDAWRIETYVSSIKVQQVRHGSETHGTSGRELNALLKALVKKGVLVENQRSSHLMSIAEQR